MARNQELQYFRVYNEEHSARGAACRTREQAEELAPRVSGWVEALTAWDSVALNMALSEDWPEGWDS